MILSFTVDVELTFVTGKFAPKDELVEQIQEALEGANLDSIDAGDGGEYQVESWDVSLVEKPKPVRRRRVVTRAVKEAVVGGPVVQRTPEPSQGSLGPAIERLPKGLVKERVTVLWREGPQADYVNVLTYTPEGTIRTYTRDAIDPRITIHAEAKTKDEAIDFLRAGDGKHLLVPVAVAKQLGDATWEFDQ